MRHTLLEVSERLIRERGYAAFSVAELARALSIADDGIAECFDTREEICMELVERHIVRIGREIDDIYIEYGDAQSRLIAYACLRSEDFVCGVPPLSVALSASRACLPDVIRNRVSDLFTLQFDWIRKVVQDHFDSSDRPSGASSTQIAKLLLGALEGGAMLECAANDREPSASGYILLMTQLGLHERSA